MKLVGASNGTIRTPFILETVLSGPDAWLADAMHDDKP